MTTSTLDYNAEPAEMVAKTTLMGIPFVNVTMDEAIDLLILRSEGESATQVSFVNADCVNITYRDAEYLDVLRQSGLNFSDGVGMKLAGRWLGHPVVDNVNGTDMFPLLCARLAKEGKSLYLLGARPGVGEEVRAWVEANHPGVRVVGVQHGFFSKAEENHVIEAIASAKPDFLLVAFGVPRQEKWIHRHLESLNTRVAMGVGGLFDFYSGRVPRAPLWIRRIGMEWSWRMYQEPRRLARRYLLGNPLFMWRVLWTKSMVAISLREM
jgi:N-acetylglucosaminyldiphosphoundecaprenol N-acetyl-beta-D-mannosaminyltransferase